MPDWESVIPAQTRATSEPAPQTTPRRSAPSPQWPLTGQGTGRSGASDNGSSGWVSLDQWTTQHKAGVLTQWTDGGTSCYGLRSGQGTLVLRPGSRVARWNGLELRLGFAPQQINFHPFVHSLDLDKTIQPLLEWTPSLASSIIVIDPGHGGADCGARSVLGDACEKEYTLDWALRLRRLLIEQGWNVLVTRTADTEMALSDRVSFASQRSAALFLSLHFNSAAPNQTEAGLETYCLTPAGMTSSLFRDAAEDISQAFPNNAFDAANIALAVRLHRSLLEVAGQQDRGVRRARFPAVLRGQQCPAVLIEGGYLSNPQEARQIADPAHRQKLAEAVAGALRRNEMRVQK